MNKHSPDLSVIKRPQRTRRHKYHFSPKHFLKCVPARLIAEGANVRLHFFFWKAASLSSRREGGVLAFPPEQHPIKGMSSPTLSFPPTRGSSLPLTQSCQVPTRTHKHGLVLLWWLSDKEKVAKSSCALRLLNKPRSRFSTSM